MQDLVKRTVRELKEEVSYITQYLRHWWNSMGDGEQLFFVGILCASCLLLGLRRPMRKKTKGYEQNDSSGIAQQFLFAAVVLLVFTFGIDIALETYR